MDHICFNGILADSLLLAIWNGSPNTVLEFRGEQGSLKISAVDASATNKGGAQVVCLTSRRVSLSRGSPTLQRFFLVNVNQP